MPAENNRKYFDTLSLGLESIEKEKTRMKVFLGGTCYGSKWRNELIPLLESAGIDYVNPVVADWTQWTPECRQQGIKEREDCDFVLHVITPKMAGCYSVAAVVDDSNKIPEKTIFMFLLEDEGFEFVESQIKSLESITNMINKNGATTTYTWEGVVAHLEYRRQRSKD